jgi:uncharacterized SAM-binding protein YcdF (DUF218 family)
MFLFLSKFLPLFVYPLGLTIVLIGAAMLLRNRARWQMGMLIAAAALLWLSSVRPVALLLAQSLERQHPPLARGVTAPAIVVLGGGAERLSAPRPLAEMNESGDRMLYAAWLYQQGVAPRLVLTGGSFPDNIPPSEAASMAQIMEVMGVPRDALLLEEASRNTYENALLVHQMLKDRGIEDIILVTSASHMPRSVQLFENVGFNVTPAPTDYMATDASWEDLRRTSWPHRLVYFLPSAGSLEMSTRVLKEYIGLLVYRLRGWI